MTLAVWRVKLGAILSRPVPYCAAGWLPGRGCLLFHAETRTTARERGELLEQGELLMGVDDITGAVIEEAIRIHRRPGPGLLEAVYERLLERRLQRRGLRVESQVGVDFMYDSIDFKDGFRLDLLVEKCVILEVKSLERGLAPVHAKQLLTYLRLTDLQVGLLLNFGCATMKEGIKRVVNDLPPSDSPGLSVNQKE
jgi:GxxExxY protein